MRALTVKERLDYLKFPHRCPYCKSDAISVNCDNTDAGGNTILQDVSCDGCHAEWQDYYELKDIVELT